MCFGADDSTADIQNRTLGFLNQTDDLIQGQVACLFHWVITSNVHRFREDRLGLGLLNVFRKINDHRPGSACCRNVKRLLHHARNIRDVGDQEAVLDHRQGHPEEIGLLKRPFTNHGLRHLPGNGNQWNGIHECIGNTRDQVGRTRPTGCHADTRFSGCSRVALGGKGTALLVPGKDDADLIRASQRLMKFHARTAGVSKDGVDRFALQCSDQNVTATHRWTNVGFISALRILQFHLLAGIRLLHRLLHGI